MFQSVAFLLLAVSFVAINAQSSTEQPGVLRCQFTNGTMMPSATVCQDTIGSCSTIFGAPVTTTSTSRPSRCDLDDLQDMASQCARTCGICCEQPAYDCVDPVASPINCAANTRYCRNSNWTDVMAQYCPATCGLCVNGTCSDNVAGCSSMVALCENINWYTWMQTNCARSCGTCTTSSSVTTTSSTSCSNIASNCAANVALCNNSVYYSLMTTNCAATCGRCSSSTTCTNSNANCATWASNGFCSSSFYTTAQKRSYCASSCGLC
uniref:ShKT domain-containing protein n=1 Tax=Panagrellus redivivus TaxID=6233 RepID=A0A7E4ZTX9_PANRE